MLLPDFLSLGEHPSENLGSMSRFGVPDKVQRSGSAKAVWRAELQRSSSPEKGVLALAITPPAACPVGEYKMSAKLGEEERNLATLSVLFNPWCPGRFLVSAQHQSVQTLGG